MTANRYRVRSSSHPARRCRRRRCDYTERSGRGVLRPILYRESEFYNCYYAFSDFKEPVSIHTSTPVVEESGKVTVLQQAYGRWCTIQVFGMPRTKGQSLCVTWKLWRPRPTPDYKQTPWIDGRERADIQKLLVTNPPTIHRGRIINEATRCQIGRILQTNMRPSRRA